MEVFGKFRKIKDIIGFSEHKRNSSQNEDSRHNLSVMNETKVSDEVYKTHCDQGTSPLNFKKISRISKRRKKRRVNRTFSSLRKKSYNSVIPKHKAASTSKFYGQFFKASAWLNNLNGYPVYTQNPFDNYKSIMRRKSTAQGQRKKNFSLTNHLENVGKTAYL